MSSLVPSLRVLSKSVVTYSQLLLLSTSSIAEGGSAPSCPLDSQISCRNTSTVTDTCCFNAPGGQLLQTQFWDTSPPTGPSDSWTVHGLWPDRCDGTYEANCDPNRAYTNITAILQAAGATDTLSYMTTYWKDYQGNDESFWEHEWGKHGTCISTLEPSCYTNYVAQEEVVAYFAKTVDLFKTLPSYTWLSAAGIVPSTTATYTSAEILAALKAPRGVDVVVQCNANSELDEIWYFYNVQGSVQSGTFIPTPPDGSKGSCAATGIKYLPKTPTTPPTPTTLTTTTAVSTPTPTSPPGAPFSGKGTLVVTTSGKVTGCIISGGTWYTSGTCAGFTATASGTGFTLRSSKGLCAVQSSNLVCAASVTTGSVFTASGIKLAFEGKGVWYASSVPSGTTQAVVSTAQLATKLEISWKGS